MLLDKTPYSHSASQARRTGWVPANLMSGVRLPWTSILSRELYADFTFHLAVTNIQATPINRILVPGLLGVVFKISDMHPSCLYGRPSPLILRVSIRNPSQPKKIDSLKPKVNAMEKCYITLDYKVTL